MKKLILIFFLVSFVLFFVPSNVSGFGLCDSSPQSNLFVSSEGRTFSGPQVVEVAVCDSGIQVTNEAVGEPDVKVNGKKLRMVQSSDGSWYAFFADRAMAQLADSTTQTPGKGLDFGEFCSASTLQNVTGISLSETNGFSLPKDGADGANGQASINACNTAGSGTVANHVVRNPPSINTAISPAGQIGIISNAWPLVQLYDFTYGGNVVVTYNKGGGTQTITMPFDTGTGSSHMDKTVFSPSSDVAFTIHDSQLNIDPTSKDSWTFATAPTVSNVYYQFFSGNTIDGDASNISPLKNLLSSLMFENNGVLTINNANGILKLDDNNDEVLVDFGGQLGTQKLGPLDFAVTVTEQGINSEIFANTDSNGDSNIDMVQSISDPTKNTATISYGGTTHTISLVSASIKLDKSTYAVTDSAVAEITCHLANADSNIIDFMSVSFSGPKIDPSSETITGIETSISSAVFAGEIDVSVISNPTTSSQTITAQATCGSTTLSATATVAATTTQSQITLTPTSANPGTSVAVSGSGFPPSTTIPVAFDGTTINSFISSATGTFSGNILIPASATAGTHSIQAAPGTAHAASASFTVIAHQESSDEQKRKEAYDGLFVKVEDKVEPPIIEDYTKVQKPAKVPEPKQDTKIYDISKSPNPQQYAINSGLDYKDGKVRLVITANPTQATLDKIKQIATVESVVGNQIQLAVDVKKIGDITKLSEVSSLRAPAKAIQSSTTSEGSEFVSADKVQTKGTTGKGVKVAVLDLGFDIKNAELGTGLQSKSFRKDFGKTVDIKGFGYEYVHGTAVAEIIKDIAPGVQLYLYSFGTETEFQEAMSEAIKQNVDIISMSAGWLNYPSDGSSAMTKKVEDAIKKGIPFIVSSGNYAETHWEGKYSDTVKNGWHEFSGKDEGLSVEVDSARVNAKAPIVLYVMWDAKSGVYDFDLTLTDSGGKRVSSSSNVQKAKTNAMYEYIFYTPTAAGTYSLGISYSGTTSPNTTIEVFSPTDMLEYTTAKGSVSVPNDAEGIISVGAIHVLYAELEPFSSQGPANNGKSVPNVVAPDAVTTVAYGGEPFYGTSAAQPHVTGIAALLLEKNQNLSPADIKKYLQDKADKSMVGIKSADNVYGHGKADALFITNTEIKATQSGTTSSKTTTPSTTAPRTGSTTQQGAVSDVSIPGWIKSNARWWYDGAITDQDFAKGIEFMIKEGIIHVPATEKSDKKESNIPSWVKQNAKFWVDDLITDKDFAAGIQHLVKSGIISVGSK